MSVVGITFCALVSCVHFLLAPLIVLIFGVSRICVSGYAIAQTSIQRELGVSKTVSSLGITLFTVTFGVRSTRPSFPVTQIPPFRCSLSERSTDQHNCSAGCTTPPRPIVRIIRSIAYLPHLGFLLRLVLHPSSAGYEYRNDPRFPSTLVSLPTFRIPFVLTICVRSGIAGSTAVSLGESSHTIRGMPLTSCDSRRDFDGSLVERRSS